MSEIKLGDKKRKLLAAGFYEMEPVDFSDRTVIFSPEYLAAESEIRKKTTKGMDIVEGAIDAKWAFPRMRRCERPDETATAMLDEAAITVLDEATYVRPYSTMQTMARHGEFIRQLFADYFEVEDPLEFLKTHRIEEHRGDLRTPIQEGRHSEKLKKLIRVSSIRSQAGTTKRLIGLKHAVYSGLVGDEFTPDKAYTLRPEPFGEARESYPSDIIFHGEELVLYETPLFLSASITHDNYFAPMLKTGVLHYLSLLHKIGDGTLSGDERFKAFANIVDYLEKGVRHE